jgi:hypothetical protein
MASTIVQYGEINEATVLVSWILQLKVILVSLFDLLLCLNNDVSLTAHATET